MKTRRFFAGNTLPQALMAAARYHALSPDDLAYRQREKRHGFVTRIRRYIVEVDPAAPLRTGREAQPAAVAAPPQPSAGKNVLLAQAAPPAVRAEPAPRLRPPVPPTPAAAPRPRAASPSSHADPFLPPDEESELAASVAVGHLLTLARLELTVRVERQPDRLLISLAGQDEALLRELGEEFLDDLEHLVPRAIRGLAGRMVRCKVEGAGLRSAREDELRALAERAAAEAVEGGEAVLLEPLSAADRRIVHLTLVDDPRVTTESQGFGAEKRILIVPAPPSIAS
ncbi:MAG: R3H domain-containing nucleic acid-binding protein [Thermoanaerobaculia bacterium]